MLRLCAHTHTHTHTHTHKHTHMHTYTHTHTHTNMPARTRTPLTRMYACTHTHTHTLAHTHTPIHTYSTHSHTRNLGPHPFAHANTRPPQNTISKHAQPPDVRDLATQPPVLLNQLIGRNPAIVPRPRALNQPRLSSFQDVAMSVRGRVHRRHHARSERGAGAAPAGAYGRAGRGVSVARACAPARLCSALRLRLTSVSRSTLPRSLQSGGGGGGGGG
jgi:hypothetical protein